MDDSRLPSRRRVLVAALVGATTVVGGAAAVRAGLLPGATAPAIGIDAAEAPAPVGGGPPTVVFDELCSARRGTRVRWAVAVPDGVPARGLPVVLVLHGRGGDAAAAFGPFELDEYLAAHVRAGGRPFAVVAADGGDAYWHPRRSGDDPLRMFTDELLPLLAGRGLAVARIGVMGWSMGGYGALLLARQSARGELGPTRVAAAVAASPALFASVDTASAGAFDDAADFARWGALVDDPGVGGTPLHVACGASDPFAEQTARYRAAVEPTPTGGIGPGGHEIGYWHSLVPGQFAFLATHLGPD